MSTADRFVALRLRLVILSPSHHFFPFYPLHPLYLHEIITALCFLPQGIVSFEHERLSAFFESLRLEQSALIYNEIRFTFPVSLIEIHAMNWWNIFPCSFCSLLVSCLFTITNPDSRGREPVALLSKPSYMSSAFITEKRDIYAFPNFMFHIKIRHILITKCNRLTTLFRSTRNESFYVQTCNFSNWTYGFNWTFRFVYFVRLPHILFHKPIKELWHFYIPNSPSLPLTLR